ncbi:MAG: hypothetical protein WKF43_06040 [Acidimicrobiales bacterium]
MEASPDGLGLLARTIWSAIDLAMTPLELDEIVAARDHLEGCPRASGSHRPQGGGRPP